MRSEDLQGKSEQLALISRELDSEIASQSQRSAAMEQRATLLIGAASVVGALQATDGFSWFVGANLLLSFVAALAGVIAVFPRRGDALDVRPMRNAVLGMDSLLAEYRIADTKLEILEADETWLSNRGAIVRIGFIALTLSIAVALLALFSPADSAEQPEAPSPTTSVGP